MENRQRANGPIHSRLINSTDETCAYVCTYVYIRERESISDGSLMELINSPVEAINLSGAKGGIFKAAYVHLCNPSCVVNDLQVNGRVPKPSTFRLAKWLLPCKTLYQQRKLIVCLERVQRVRASFSTRPRRPRVFEAISKAFDFFETFLDTPIDALALPDFDYNSIMSCSRRAEALMRRTVT